MADYTEVDKTIIKRGYVRMKGRFLGKSWRKKILVLYMPSSKGSSRLVKYTNEKALEDEESSSEIFLTDVASALRCKMSDGSDGDGITLQMMDRSIKQFLCDSESESNAWLNAIQPEVGKVDNLPDGMFRVYLLPCGTLNFHGECVIYVTAEYIQIYDNEKKKKLITECHITNIRRYGADIKKKQFLIEAGSMNPSGEGIYLFRTIYVKEIHTWVEYSADKIKNNSTRRPSGNRVGQTSGHVYENEKY